eukprot:1186756-Prorocentrum_minimum.AAC.2
MAAHNDPSICDHAFMRIYRPPYMMAYIPELCKNIQHDITWHFGRRPPPRPSDYSWAGRRGTPSTLHTQHVVDRMLHYDGRYVTADVTAAATAHYSCAGSVCTTTEARAAVGYWEHLATHPPLLAGGAGYSSSSLTIACVETRRAYYWRLIGRGVAVSPRGARPPGVAGLGGPGGRPRARGEPRGEADALDPFAAFLQEGAVQVKGQAAHQHEEKTSTWFRRSQYM